ncbi:ubiquitin carboxyl-terminal hydrolase 8-like [Tachypleus tridentatus]|uniref:ubiquitin carboxyl-terminal hydrolase 8-like n=1 Tax=Tachypleus tridentatus TaxID=6853 RepID=UPI003FD0042F
MPGAGVKNLYLAKSLKELNKLTDTPIQDVKNIKIACSSARKVYNEAKSCQQLGDEEKSYVLFMRYFSLVKSIRKTVEYQKNKEYFDKLMGEQSFNETMTSAEKLSASLSKRYGVLQESKKSEEKETNKSPSLSEKENIKQKQTIIESNHTKLLFHEQTNGERELIEKENCITSQKLYELFMDTSVSLLIMDARPSKDFLNSHIKHSSCINVPSEILKPGITAVGLTKSIPEDFLFQWNQRNLVDFVVILDWNSTENSVKMGSPLHSLCEAIWKWDASKVLKSKPLILEGGYEDWLLRYPMLTTNANVTAPNLDLSISSAVLSNKLVSEVDYPNLDEALSESSDSSSSVQDNTTFTIKFQDLSLKPINISPPVVNRSTKPSSLTEITDKKKAFFKERVDRSSFDSVSIDKSSGPENKNSSLKTVQIPDRKLKPKSTSSASSDPKLSFDRLSSPVKSSAEQDKEQELQIKEHSVAEESLEIAKEQLEKEKQFEALRLKRACEAEEGMRLELQKQEEALLERINALEEEKRKKDIEMQKIQDYCEKMRQQLKKHEQQKSEEEERLSQIEATKKTILQETERLRRERKQKEKEKEEHRKQKEKEKHDMEMREKTHLKSQEDSAHTKALSKHATGSEVRGRPNSAKEGEYIVQLKEDEGLSTKHGLSRSHSSPNIAQMIAEENDQSVKAWMPQYDRSLKPRNEISSSPSHYGGKLVELNAARLRNLTPVYGNQGQAGTGLKNLGNTCFMNSVLQCLVNTTTLAIHFISGQYKRQINVENKQGTRGELAEEFAVIVTAMWTGQYRSVAPKDFKNAVGKHIPGFLGYEQQDSHEFLVMLLEKLHGDLNRVNFKAKSKLPDLDDIPDSIAVTRFWDYHISHNSSIIGDEFEGLLQSTLTCLFCKKTSSSYEVFSCLSIPIPSGNRCTIKDCLQLFLRTEQMSGEGAWDCPRCKQKRDAEKKLAICKLPQILIIHLKRFSYEGMWRRKLQNYVDFPLTDFDLKPYVNMSVTKSYNLYGVANHYGTLEGGHYIAHVKTSINEKWYKYDDQEVSEMSPADVKTSAAYILFYTSVDLRAPLHASLKV